MSGSAPMLNQLHKMAMMRKRTLIGDNELYEMMRSKQVYHVQTDLQKRLSETLQSLEHDRQLALAGILSRKLVFMKQVDKRERKRTKLVDVKKQMDEILRDTDLDRLSISLNEVWESNQPGVDGKGQAGDKEDTTRPRVWGKTKTSLETPLQTPGLPDISVDGSSKNLKRIEKGVDLYLASVNASRKPVKSDELLKSRVKPSALPSILVSSQDDRLEEKSFVNSALSPLPPHGAAPFKDSSGDKLIIKSRESSKDQGAHFTPFETDPPRKTFETETSEIQLKRAGLSYHKNAAEVENLHTNDRQNGKLIRKKKSKESKNERNRGLDRLHTVDHHSEESESNSANIQQSRSGDTFHDNQQTLDIPQEHEDSHVSRNMNESPSSAKPSPPYLVSKPGQTSRAPTNLAPVRPACVRAGMERTVTMVYVEDSHVQTPKSSFDVDAWLAFIRQKKGYSATLKDGPLERPLDEADTSGKVFNSKRNVKFAMRKKKLKALRPPCKTCRHRAMEWFKEFSQSGKKRKGHFSSKNTDPLKAEGSPQAHLLASSQSQTASLGGNSAELPRLRREATSQLLQRVREDSKVLQEKVHHLCSDDYWKFWSNHSTANDV